MNDSLLLPIILQLAGVVVVIAEIILPSGGILSIVALGASDTHFLSFLAKYQRRSALPL